MAAVALGQTGRALVEGEAVDVAVLADAARFPRLGRIVPGPFTHPHYPGPDIGGDQGPHQDLAALVEGPHQIAILDAARFGVVRMDQDRLPIGDGELVPQRGVVELGVQPLGRVGGVERQRIARRHLALHPLLGLIPLGMTGAVGITHPRHRVGEDLDLAGRGTERVEQRVLAKIGVTDPLAVGLRDREADVVVGLPEHVERRQRHPGTASLGRHAVVHLLEPQHLVLPFGVLLLHAQLGGDGAEDVEVVAGFKLGRHALVHGEDVALGVVAPHLQVVALVAGGDRQHDVGVFGSRRPVGLVDDHGLRLAPRLQQVVGVLMVVEGVAPRHVDQLDVRIGHLAAVEVDGLARVGEAVGDAGHRDGGRAVLRCAASGDARQNAALGGGAATGGVVVTEAVAAPRQADLAQHGGQSDQHPVGLLPVVLTLHAPARHDHGALGGHVEGQLADHLGIDAADGARPLGALRLTVILAEQVGEEGVEADGVAIEEGLIVLLLAVEGVGHPQHHGHVGVGVRGNPLGADQLGGLVVDGVDADDPGAFLFQRLEAGLPLVIRHVPAVLQGHLGVDPPEHHQFGVLHHVGPGGLLFVHLDGAHHVGHDHLSRAGGVVTGITGEAAGEVHQAVQQGAAVVEHADTLPAVGTGVDRLRAEIRLDALDLAGHQFDGLLPAHPYPLVGSAQLRSGTRAVLQPAFAHHGVLDAVLGVDLERRHVDEVIRCRIVGHRLDPHHAALGDDGLEGSPVGAGQDALLGGHQGGELLKGRADGLGQGAFREETSQQGQGGTGPQPLEQSTAGEVGLLVIEKSHGRVLCSCLNGPRSCRWRVSARIG